MQRIEAEVLQLGGRILFVGPETEENAVQMMEKTHASIPLLYDIDGSVMEAYRLAFELPPALRGLDLAEANPAAGWRLPIPATFVIAQDGRIRARFINTDYTYRMEPSEILTLIRELAKDTPQSAP